LAGDISEGSRRPADVKGPSARVAAIRARLEAAGLDRQLAAASLAPLAAAAIALLLVIPTLAPGVIQGAAGDSAEFQTVAWVLGTAHPTGYPSYVVLGFLFDHLVPIGDPAFRLNLLSAILGAGAVAGTAAVVRLLTGTNWIALATGLLMLVMPTFSSVSATFPAGGSFKSTPAVWRLATYADPHMFHLALATLIFLLLLVWEQRRTSGDEARRRHADRWLAAAAVVFGVALANHSLTLMLAPGIALFVLAVAPRIVLQWRLVVGCALLLVGTAVAFWLELPIRAAMHAPLVYAHPDTWNGFMYVVTGQQFGGIPPTIWDDLGLKAQTVASLLSGWLGPLGLLAVLGLGTSLVRRPRFVLLSLLAAAMTAGFAAAYVNSDLERYFLVPIFVAFTYVGLGLADAVSLGSWLLESAISSYRTAAAGVTGAAGSAAASAESATSGAEAGPAGEPAWPASSLRAVGAVVAIVVVIASSGIVAAREQVASATNPAGLSQTNQTSRQTWLDAVLAPPDQGGLPADSVIVSNWSDSTTLWYGQLVEGRRRDVYVVDDSMRVPAGDNLGQVWDVIDTYLGHRPVFLLRFPWNCDGMDNLSRFYQLTDYPLANGYSIKEVVAKTRSVVCS
jgi:Protein O-mannosyl-transferase TMEM260-like